MKYLQWRLILGTVAIVYGITICTFFLVFIATPHVENSIPLGVQETLNYALFDVISSIAKWSEILWQAIPILFFTLGPLLVASLAKKRKVFHGLLTLICLVSGIVILSIPFPVLLLFLL